MFLLCLIIIWAPPPKRQQHQRTPFVVFILPSLSCEPSHIPRPIHYPSWLSPGPFLFPLETMAAFITHTLLSIKYWALFQAPLTITTTHFCDYFIFPGFCSSQSTSSVNNWQTKMLTFWNLSYLSSNIADTNDCNWTHLKPQKYLYTKYLLINYLPFLIVLWPLPLPLWRYSNIYNTPCWLYCHRMGAELRSWNTYYTPPIKSGDINTYMRC